MTGKVRAQKTGARERSVAKQIAREKERQLLLDSIGVPQLTRKPIISSEFQEEYLAYIGSRGRAGTEAAYGISLTHYSGIVGAKCVHEVDKSILQDFVLRRRRENLATREGDAPYLTRLAWRDSCGYHLGAISPPTASLTAAAGTQGRQLADEQCVRSSSPFAQHL